MQGIKFIPKPKRAAVFLDKRSEKRRDFCLKKNKTAEQNNRREVLSRVLFFQIMKTKNMHTLSSLRFLSSCLLFLIPLTLFLFPLNKYYFNY